MMKKIDLRSYPLFKMLLFGYFFAFASILSIFGILALIGIVPANLNNKEYFGIAGFIIHLLSIPLMTIIFTCLNWIVLYFGLYIYDKVSFIIEK